MGIRVTNSIDKLGHNYMLTPLIGVGAVVFLKCRTDLDFKFHCKNLTLYVRKIRIHVLNIFEHDKVCNIIPNLY